jgi:predicted RecB family nuclease
MDKILKAHFDSFRDRNELPPELAELKGTIRLFQDRRLLEEWRNNYRGITWTDPNGNVLRGAVDNLLQKDDKLIVLDYKTRGFPLSDGYAAYYQDQMDFYNFLLRKNGHRTEDYSYLLVYHPVKVSASGDVMFHTDLLKLKVDVDNAEKILRKALDVLSGDMPEASKECRYCQWLTQFPR